LTAQEHGSGDYWAIQCKFYDPTHTLQKSDIDSFFTASGRRFETTDGERGFSQRLIVATTDKWSKHAKQALENQTIPVTRLWFKDLADSPVDWSQFNLANAEGMRLTGKKALRPHQTEAVANAIEGFKASDRGNSSWPAAPARPWRRRLLPGCLSGRDRCRTTGNGYEDRKEQCKAARKTRCQEVVGFVGIRSSSHKGELMPSCPVNPGSVPAGRPARRCCSIVSIVGRTFGRRHTPCARMRPSPRSRRPLPQQAGVARQ